MKKYVKLEELQELSYLSYGFEILTGTDDGSQDLYVQFDPDLKLPVFSDNRGSLVGYFQYSEDVENIVFVTAVR